MPSKPLMPLAEAVHAARTLCPPLPKVSLPPLEALGMFIADAVDAPRDLPGCDNSAMDGYAVQAGDTRGATRDRPVRLRVVETIFAGHAPVRSVRSGEAARIFTGAPMPQGADAVVRQEATRPGASPEEVEIVVEASPGDHLRRCGEETRRGQRVLHAGARVDAAVVGLTASLGLEALAVRPRPKVAVLAIGDELLPAGTNALPHQIHDSNGVMVAALAIEAGAQVVAVRRAGDDRASLSRELASLLELADVVVTCGGASVGEKDLVKDVLRSLDGVLRVDGVALKPGKPVGLALVRGRPVLVLPGNPGAAMVAFDQLGRALLFALQGVREERRRVRATLLSPQRKRPPLTALSTVQLDGLQHTPRARIRPQGAGQLLQNVGMDGWALLPPGRSEHAAGEAIDVELREGSAFVPLDAAPAVAFVGWSGAGKTTLLERLLPGLRQRGQRVAVVKHSSHAHAPPDAPDDVDGSDTQRLRAAGAAYVTLSTAAQAQGHGDDIRAVVRALRTSGMYDLVLVEGWKDGPLPKIEVWREGLEPPVSTTHANVRATVQPDCDLASLSQLLEGAWR